MRKKKDQNETLLPAEETGRPALDIRNLTVEYRVEKVVTHAVTDVSLSVEEGHTLGLVGETGAGKTTTALAALQLVPNPPGMITSGEIYVCGMDMRSFRPKQLEKIRGKEISMIFQDPMTSLNPVFTVGEQIQESILQHEHCSRTEAWEKAEEMLEMVGIPKERANEYPHQFSGGMKQRVIIAIALACNPRVLIADEPTTALDVTIQAQVLEMMKKLKEQFQTAMIMITHDLGIVAEICDEVAVMYAGRIVEKGTLEDVFDRTAHPYTEGLFNSLPNIHDRKAKLIPIPGMMPDPTNLPEGCSFAPRCRYATDKCKAGIPEVRSLGGIHEVACHAYEDPSFHLERRDLE
ncbi:MAG: ABC transporter ATP-binding protein [Lachnospiraceae bacterium]|nr:ABC transporter ATP-binding protein [Lachnospiraceae bacterium]